jgi:hypothetical protein
LELLEEGLIKIGSKEYIYNRNDDKKYKAEDRWKNKNLFKKIVKFFTPEPPPFNMPKSQSCKDCGAYSRRIRFTNNGAYYKCHNHGEFILLSKYHTVKVKSSTKRRYRHGVIPRNS